MNTKLARRMLLCLLAALFLTYPALAAGDGVSAELDAESAAVTVTVTAAGTCRVVVAWYSGAGRLLHVSARETGGGKYSFPYPASEIVPRDVGAKVFLLDGDTGIPLCPAAAAVKRSQAIELPLL